MAITPDENENINDFDKSKSSSVDRAFVRLVHNFMRIVFLLLFNLAILRQVETIFYLLAYEVRMDFKRM